VYFTIIQLFIQYKNVCTKTTSTLQRRHVQHLRGSVTGQFLVLRPKPRPVGNSNCLPRSRLFHGGTKLKTDSNGLKRIETVVSSMVKKADWLKGECWGEGGEGSRQLAVLYSPVQ
jgi:hypothetical protein